ncbi:MAG: metallopeptidase [Planctomycetales bacterium]
MSRSARCLAASICWAFVFCAIICPTTRAEDAENAKDAEKKERGFYRPMKKEIEGWTIAVDPLLVCKENQEVGEKAFKALANHLQRIEYIVPEDRLKQLKKLPIWIELNNTKLGAMQYHPDRGWLTNNGHDPRLEKHVHIPHAKALFQRGTWAKHPYVILHELAHSYHDQVLGFGHEDVLKSYNEAKKQGIYKEVLLYTGRKVRHYGLSNHKEHFAEATEAYFGMNDFYPFVRAELREHDPLTFSVLEKVWGPVR